MWSAEWDGTRHRFHLAGINNQNFLMRDETTGSWWQQSTGLAIMGPLRGRALEAIPFEETTLGAWRDAHPAGRVLAPDAAALEAERYAKSDWEQRMAKAPVVTPEDPDAPFPPRELIVGVEIAGTSRAYAMSVLKADRVVQDHVAGVPIALVLGDDGRTVRVFERRVAGAEADLFAKPETAPLRLVDSATASEWSFDGVALTGPLAGQSLPRHRALPSYWFDWNQQHPATTAYR